MNIEDYDCRSRSIWLTGEWDHEPDKAWWEDEETGFPCLIIRSNAGTWCGYVGVEQKHPYHGKDYDDHFYILGHLDCHGGVTFTGKNNHRIFRKGKKKEDQNTWWIGFDCNHAGDLMPIRFIFNVWGDLYGDDAYRNIDYVKNECRKLAQQLKQVESYGN